jgi:hypothetical protein
MRSQNGECTIAPAPELFLKSLAAGESRIRDVKQAILKNI